MSLDWSKFEVILLGTQKEKNPFEMTENDKAELAIINKIISEAQAAKITKLRELACKNGAAALKLEDLKSESGKTFVDKGKEFGCRSAVVLDISLALESAYLCISEYVNEADNTDTCGWVKGAPRQENYNNIGPLSGSAGTRFYCRICNKQLSKYATMFS